MITFSNLMIPTSDHEAALAFYRDLLGLELVNDVNTDAGRWINLRSADQPEFGYTLGSVAVGPGISDADIVAFEIPTGVPILYTLDAGLKATDRRFLPL